MAKVFTKPSILMLLTEPNEGVDAYRSFRQPHIMVTNIFPFGQDIEVTLDSVEKYVYINQPKGPCLEDSADVKYAQQVNIEKLY